MRYRMLDMDASTHATQLKRAPGVCMGSNSVAALSSLGHQLITPTCTGCLGLDLGLWLAGAIMGALHMGPVDSRGADLTQE